MYDGGALSVGIERSPSTDGCKYVIMQMYNTGAYKCFGKVMLAENFRRSSVSERTSWLRLAVSVPSPHCWKRHMYPEILRGEDTQNQL